ncbi:thioredoxin family protein [Bacillus mycoides]
MKKWILVIVTLIIASGSMFFLFNKTEDEKPLYKNVSMKGYKQKMDDKEDFIIYIYSPTCTFCKSFKPTLNETIKETDLKILALDTSVSDNLDNTFFNKYKIEHTPTLIYYSRGEEKDRREGNISKKDLLEFLEPYRNVGTAKK